MQSILFRIGIVMFLVLIFFIVIRYINKRNFNTKRLALEHIEKDIPVILYFTTPYCQICKNVQEPELRKLKDDLKNGVKIVKINAMKELELAKYWRVLSVPTTFVFDTMGRSRQFNIGVATSEKLLKQLTKNGGSFNGKPIEVDSVKLS